MALARARAPAERGSFQAWVLQQGVRALLARVPAGARLIVNVADRPSPWPEREGTEAPYDAIVELWTPGAHRAAPVLAEALAARAGAAHVYRAEEAIYNESPTGHNPAAVNLIAVWDVRPGLPRSEARRHWQEHVPLALAIHHGNTRYVQTWLAEALSHDAPPHAGIASLRFPSLEAITSGLFRSPDDVKVIEADVAEFVGASPVMYTTEHHFGGSE